LTDQIIKAFFKVYNMLGYGFTEKVYQNAMVIELGNRGFTVRPQAPINVYYEGHLVGEYFADVLVNDLIILELEAVGSIVAEHGSQLINYLKASHLEVGLVMNFGPKPEFQRRVFDHKTGTDEIEDF
jgi:GxxExxY protein